MFLEPETKKLVESVLDAEVNQDLFDQCVQQFGKEYLERVEETPKNKK